MSSAEPDDLRLADQEYPTWAWIRYTQLPEDMPPRVAELAREITADADTPYDKAKAVESWLKTNIAYNLAIDPPPFGSDGVDHFLFESKEGYSEYFGSAMTVLMRSVGIPARMTTGYTTGNLIDGSNLYLVSDRHSHGWARSLFPRLRVDSFRAYSRQGDPGDRAAGRAGGDGRAESQRRGFRETCLAKLKRTARRRTSR